MAGLLYGPIGLPPQVTTNPTLLSTLSFLQQVGACGLASGVETAVLGGSTSLALAVVHGALISGGYTSGPTPVERLTGILDGYSRMNALGQSIALRVIPPLLRTASSDVDQAIRGFGGVSASEENGVRRAKFTMASLGPHGVHPSDIGAERGNPAAAYYARLGADIFRLLAEQGGGGGGLLISPPAIGVSVRLALEGSKGGTRDELRKLFGYPEATDSIYREFEAWLVQALRYPDPITFRTGSAVLGGRRSLMLPGYVSLMREMFASFMSKHDEVGIPEFSTWVKKLTDGWIGGLKDGELAPHGDALHILGASWFRGRFDFPVYYRVAMEGPFRSAKGGSAQCDFVSFGAQLKHLDDDMYRMVELPYGDGSASLVIVLPKGDPVKLSELEGVFGVSSLADSLSRLRQGYDVVGAVSLPVSDIVSRLSLQGALQLLGARQAFMPGIADFSVASTIGATSDPATFLGSVWHMAAFTIGIEDFGSGNGARKDIPSVQGIRALESEFEFVADRPFFYAVIDRQTDLPLLMGWMDNPASPKRREGQRMKSAIPVGIPLSRILR